MDDVVQRLLDFLSTPVVLAILGVGAFASAVAAIIKFADGIRKAFHIAYRLIKNFWPAFWKAVGPFVIILAFLIALIGPVGYIAWQFLYLSVTRIEQVSKPPVFLSLFYQETTFIVVYSMLWATAAHFWLLPRLFRRRSVSKKKESWPQQ